MNKTTFVLGITAAVAATAIVFPKVALAYRGDPNVQGPNYTAERHEAMTKAFTNKDYNAWKTLMNGKGRVTQVINEGNFAKFAEAHKLMLEGKKDEAAKIRAELGLGLRNGSGQMNGGGQNRYNR
jgi:hypothetical protein